MVRPESSSLRKDNEGKWWLYQAPVRVWSQPVIANGSPGSPGSPGTGRWASRTWWALLGYPRADRWSNLTNSTAAVLKVLPSLWLATHSTWGFSHVWDIVWVMMGDGYNYHQLSIISPIDPFGWSWRSFTWPDFSGRSQDIIRRRIDNAPKHQRVTFQMKKGRSAEIFISWIWPGVCPKWDILKKDISIIASSPYYHILPTKKRHKLVGIPRFSEPCWKVNVHQRLQHSKPQFWSWGSRYCCRSSEECPEKAGDQGPRVESRHIDTWSSIHSIHFHVFFPNRVS